jgi:hypothetical protein
MVLVHVEYDAYTRQFKLIDHQMARALIDGETYMVMADVSVQDVMRGGSEAAAVRVEGAPVSIE